MTWYDRDSLATWAFGPYFTSIIFTFIVVISLPILLHVFLYRAKPASALPKFLVCGPSGSGKTTLVTNFESRDSSHAQTHTSIDVLTVEASLPSSTIPGSSRYRSTNDPTVKDSPPPRLLLSDTPGHSKLRNHALATLSSTEAAALAGIIFVVDAADLSADNVFADGKTGLADAAGYLHDVLLALQNRQALIRSNKRKPIQVLIAANKMDLFTALPIVLVRRTLEAEIGRERQSRARGLLQGGNTDADIRGDNEGESEPLAGVTEGSFEFGQLDEWGVYVDVLGGNTGGDEEIRTDEWWDWIAQQL